MILWHGDGVLDAFTKCIKTWKKSERKTNKERLKYVPSNWTSKQPQMRSHFISSLPYQIICYSRDFMAYILQVNILSSRFLYIVPSLFTQKVRLSWENIITTRGHKPDDEITKINVFHLAPLQFTTHDYNNNIIILCTTSNNKPSLHPRPHLTTNNTSYTLYIYRRTTVAAGDVSYSTLKRVHTEPTKSH